MTDKTDMHRETITTKFIVKGTTCYSCKSLIESTLGEMEGVSKIIVDFVKESAEIEYIPSKISIDEIFKKIEVLGFTPKIIDIPDSEDINKITLLQTTVGSISIGVSIIAIVIGGYFLLSYIQSFDLPKIEQGMGYGLLFVVGLLTGFHCISMCGGFVISYSTAATDSKWYKYLSHLMYAGGKTLSYTVMGAFFGMLGSLIAFTPQIRGISALLAGIFLLLFGLRMLNIFPILRKIHIPTPKFIKKIIYKDGGYSSPLVIGLLNGLMIACGPLQAIYVMAAGTGIAIEGAKLLFFFGIGTLPVLLSFGFVTAVISAQSAYKILKVSGVIVMLLGLYMINNGLVLTGKGYDVRSIWVKYIDTSWKDSLTEIPTNSLPIIKDGHQIIKMSVDRYGWDIDKFILKKGVPVKWEIDGKEITYCNNAINIPELNMKFDIRPGKQVIEFTPKRSGVISWSCWMGMIPGNFIVKDEIDLSDIESITEIKKDLNKNYKVENRQEGGNCSRQCGKSCALQRGSCGCSGRIN